MFFVLLFVFFSCCTQSSLHSPLLFCSLHRGKLRWTWEGETARNRLYETNTKRKKLFSAVPATLGTLVKAWTRDRHRQTQSTGCLLGTHTYIYIYIAIHFREASGEHLRTNQGKFKKFKDIWNLNFLKLINISLNFPKCSPEASRKCIAIYVCTQQAPRWHRQTHTYANTHTHTHTHAQTHSRVTGKSRRGFCLLLPLGGVRGGERGRGNQVDNNFQSSWQGRWKRLNVHATDCQSVWLSVCVSVISVCVCLSCWTVLSCLSCVCLCVLSRPVLSRPFRLSVRPSIRPSASLSVCLCLCLCACFERVYVFSHVVFTNFNVRCLRTSDFWLQNKLNVFSAACPSSVAVRRWNLCNLRWRGRCGCSCSGRESGSDCLRTLRVCGGQETHGQRDRQRDTETDGPTERERERERQTDRQTDGQTERQAERKRERQIDSQLEADRQRDRQKDRQREANRQTERQR